MGLSKRRAIGTCEAGRKVAGSGLGGKLLRNTRHRWQGKFAARVEHHSGLCHLGAGPVPHYSGWIRAALLAGESFDTAVHLTQKGLSEGRRPRLLLLGYVHGCGMLSIPLHSRYRHSGGA